MNNFDDLFEQQPQPEATEKPEPQKEKPKKQWWQIREEKQRKEAYATLDRVFGAFSEGHGDMKAYLDTQSRFPFHSARNAILIGEQCPNAKRVGGYDPRPQRTAKRSAGGTARPRPGGGRASQNH